MNTQPDEQNVVSNSAYNPFPEPQTIPGGWDLSSLPESDLHLDEEEVPEVDQ